MPHQAHKARPSHIIWIKPSQKCIFPVINPQKQKAELAGLHSNIRQWGWSWGLSCPRGLWKQKATADGWEIHGQPEVTPFLSSEHWNIHCTPQSHTMQGQTARHPNWIPNPCNSTNSATSTGSAATTQESDAGATKENLWELQLMIQILH